MVINYTHTVEILCIGEHHQSQQRNHLNETIIENLAILGKFSFLYSLQHFGPNFTRVIEQFMVGDIRLDLCSMVDRLFLRNK